MKIFILTLVVSSVFGAQIVLAQAQMPERTSKLDSCEIRKDSAGVVSPIYYLSGNLNSDSDNSENRNISPETEGIPHGLWLVTQVTIEKNTDGKMERTVFKSADEVKSHIPCPQELEVNAKTATLRYPGSWEDTADYTLNGNQLIIYILVGTQQYQYGISNGNLLLTADYNYVNNDLIAKKSENIAEHRRIILKISEQ